MDWLGILLISPIWGLLSTQLFIQAWLSVMIFIFSLVGFVKGTVPRKTTAIGMGAALSTVIAFTFILYGGFWLLTEVLPFGRTRTENIVYWVFAALAAIYVLPQIPARIRKLWRNATVPGSLEMDIYKRRMGINPDHD